MGLYRFAEIDVSKQFCHGTGENTSFFLCAYLFVDGLLMGRFQPIYEANRGVSLTNLQRHMVDRPSFHNLKMIWFKRRSFWGLTRKESPARHFQNTQPWKVTGLVELHENCAESTFPLWHVLNAPDFSNLQQKNQGSKWTQHIQQEQGNGVTFDLAFSESHGGSFPVVGVNQDFWDGCQRTILSFQPLILEPSPCRNTGGF